MIQNPVSFFQSFTDEFSKTLIEKQVSIVDGANPSPSEPFQELSFVFMMLSHSFIQKPFSDLSKSFSYF